ncbi:heterokaryon incompatibility, partial [Periconia macrospinosa]
DTPLCCDLVDYEFDDSQGYQALSYAWDSQIPTSTIFCNNQVLGITRNCELALRQLRRAQWLQTLWIDSICIDQTSLQERSNQVALMDRIYGLADTVVVWLG